MVVHYSTGELTLNFEEVKVGCIPGQGPGCTTTRWGKVKLTVFDRVQASQCCNLLSGDKGEGIWIVGLLRNERLDIRAVRRNLDSRVTSI